MGKTFLKETAQLLQAKRRKKRWTRTVISLSLVVALVTSSLLSHPAITMESTTTCGMGEHAHTADCYQRQLICGQEERAAVPATEEKVLNCSTEVHEHTDGCKDAEGNLICGKEAHTHGDNCYQTVTTPGVEGHSHSDACYQSVLTCNLPEHTHSDSCYPQTEAAPAAETVPVTEAQTAAAAEAQTQATEAQTQATEAQTQPATPAQTETIPSETAAQTESETEKVTEKETEKKWSAQELKASGSDYKITVKAPASAKIPDNAVLKVKELKKDTTPQDYAQYTQLAANKAAQQMAKDILYGRYFDLAIEADGKEIQPSDKVTVTLTYSNAVEAKAEIEVKAVYFGDQTELLNVKTNSNGQTWTEAKVVVKKMTVLAVAGIGIEETEAAEAQSETEAVTEASTETEVETEVSTEAESETEVETETEVSTEVETETETEVETETETETEIAPLTLTAEGSDYTIEVSYTAEAEIPEGAQLSVREIAPGTEEYDSYYQQALAAVQEGDTTLSFARFFDISFVLDGAEIEPKAPVSVKVSYTNAVEVPEESDVKSVHFGDTAEVLEVQTNAADGAMNEVTFEAESFSVYGFIIGTKENDETEGEVTLPIAQNDDYRVTISYSKKNVTNLPDDATVSITSYSEDSSEYNVAKEAVIAAKKEADESFDEESLGLKALDISILDSDQNEIEPNGIVNVKIEMNKLPEGWNAENLDVHHIVEEHAAAAYTMERSAARNVSLYADEVASGVAVTNGKAVAEFVTNSFSTFTISYYNYYSYDKIKIVDVNGNEIGSGKSYNLNNSTDTKMYIRDLVASANPDSSVYKFDSVHINSYNSNYTVDENAWFKYENNEWKLYESTYSETNSKAYFTVTDRNVYFVYSYVNVTVTFDVNGGDGSVAPIGGQAGELVTFPDSAGSKPGYEFVGWTDTTNLEGDVKYHRVYLPGSENELPDKDTTLYAIWANNSGTSRTDFFISITGKIATEPGYFPSADYTPGIVINDNIKSKHYWIIDTRGETVSGAHALNDVTANLKQLPTVDQMCQALNNKASELGFQVVNKNGTLQVASKDEYVNDTITKAMDPDNDTNKARYNVKAGAELYVLWYVQKYQATGDAGNTWHIDGALLVKDRVTISYVKNTEDVVTDMPYGYQQEKDPASYVTIGASGSANGTIKTPKRAGYTFDGWNTKADGTGTAYKEGDSYLLDHDTTLYAQWSKGYNRLIVNKTDMSWNVLSGAQFTLEEATGKDSDGNVVWNKVNSGTTDGNGNYTYPNVKSKTIYRLTETYAPNGYETRNAFCFEVTTGDNSEILNIFVVDMEGKKISDPDWLSKKYDQADISGGSGTIRFTVKDEQIERQVIFKKTAMDEKTPLRGAVFTLKKDDVKVDNVLTSQSNDEGIFSHASATLTYGTYTLTEETAPTGYQLVDPITFTLNDPTATTDGIYTTNTGITFSGDGAANASVSMVRSTSTKENVVTTTYTYTITVKDEPKADVTIIKTNTPAGNETEQKLGGVTFKLTKRSGSTWEKLTISNVTNNEGKFSITEEQKENGITLTGLDDGTYRLTETVAPAGYIIKQAYTTFIVTNGEVQSFDKEVTHAVLSKDDGKQVIKIRNIAGVALPNTGGSGTQLYTLSGLLLLAVALMYGLVLRRRREGGIYG